MSSSLATQEVTFRDRNYKLDVEEFVFTDTKQHPYYIESPKNDGIYVVRLITDDGQTRILTLAYRIKIYTDRDRAQAWTADSRSNYPVSCIWHWPIIYFDAEIFIFAA